MKVQEQKKTNFSYDMNNELYALGGRTVQFYKPETWMREHKVIFSRVF